MTIDLAALAAIAVMAAVTYLVRCSGLWVGRRVTFSDRTQRIVSQLPATLLISIIAPMITSAGMPHVVGTAVTVLFALKSRNVLLAMAVGIATVVLVRGQTG